MNKTSMLSFYCCAICLFNCKQDKKIHSSVFYTNFSIPVLIVNVDCDLLNATISVVYVSKLTKKDYD